MPSLPPTSDRARVVILGNDAQLAARPAVPVQLARACLSYGYAFVAPGSWGDELLAERATRCLATGDPGAALLLHCPLVEATMEEAEPVNLRSCASVSPPVATARYLRAAFARNQVHITYVGGCPGGMSPEIDEQLSPDTLLALLSEAGCAPMKEPSHFDDVVPPDRRRFASSPGGAPAPAYLAAMLPEATIRDVAPETLATVARYRQPNERCLVDLAMAAGCHCAAGAHALQRLEPPRATGSVVNPDVVVDLVPSSPPPFHAPPRGTVVGAADSGDEAQLELVGTEPSDSIDYWVRTEAPWDEGPQGLSSAEVPLSGDVGGAHRIQDTKEAPLGKTPNGGTWHGSTPAQLSPPAFGKFDVSGGLGPLAQWAESKSSHPAIVPPVTGESIREARVVRFPSPPEEMPRLPSAVAMGGSVVSLVTAPSLLRPAAYHAPPVPPVTSRERIPAPFPPSPLGEDQPSLVDAAHGTDGSSSTAHERERAAQAARRLDQFTRRPLQFGPTATVQSDTARLTGRLPCRAHGALVTRRPPDATERIEPDSTSGEPPA
jgi:hypothetical protein